MATGAVTPAGILSQGQCDRPARRTADRRSGQRDKPASQRFAIAGKIDQGFVAGTGAPPLGDQVTQFPDGRFTVGQRHDNTRQRVVQLGRRHIGAA